MSPLHPGIEDVLAAVGRGPVHERSQIVHPRAHLLLDGIEARLDAGDAVGAMRRLGAWALDARRLGPRGAALVVRASLALGRPDLARFHGPLTRAGSTLRVGPAGAWFAIDHSRVELRRQPSLRRVLSALASHPSGLRAPELFAIVWPERRVPRALIKNRVDVSLARLRALGLRGRLDRIGERIVLSGPLELAE